MGGTRPPRPPTGGVPRARSGVRERTLGIFKWSMKRTLLLDADPSLSRALPASERERARHAIVVEVRTVESGPWVPDRSDPGPNHLGLMVLEGVLSRELLVGGASSIELLHQGDLLRPWQEDTASFCDASWRCLTRVSVAALDGPASQAICRYPALVSLLVERAMRRSRSLAVHAAIETIVGLDRRLLLLFWHLAEHWGRRGPDGVLVPLALTHETLANLVGARRPSVTAALNELARAGTIERRDGQGWVLHGDPPGVSLDPSPG